MGESQFHSAESLPGVTCWLVTRCLSMLVAISGQWICRVNLAVTLTSPQTVSMCVICMSIGVSPPYSTTKLL